MIESLEARTRFFVGMFWAGVLGFIVCLFTSLDCFIRNGFSDNWIIFSLFLFFISIFSLLLFGGRLRVMRGEEARLVFFSYIEYIFAKL